MRYIIDIDLTLSSDEHRVHFNMHPCNCAYYVRSRDALGRSCIRRIGGESKPDCPKCHGTGKRTPTPEEMAQYIAPENILKDAPIPAAMAALKRLGEQQDKLEIIFLTGRHEGIRAATEEWLWRELPYEFANHGFTLSMRKTGDRRVATIHKHERLLEIASRTFNIFIDDDPHMFAVYARFPGIWLRAPQCWEHLAPTPTDVPETWWK